MIQTFISGTILSIQEGMSEDEQLICHGTFQFVSLEAKADREEIKDELEFRCKGTPAIAIKESGIGGTGVAQGYMDLKLIQMEGYKEKIPALVIRTWVSTNIMTPNPFDIADAQLAEIQAAKAIENPENVSRPKTTFAF